MKDLSGKYKHEGFNQVWRVQRMGWGADLYAVEAYSPADEVTRLGQPMHIMDLYLAELIESQQLLLLEAGRNSFLKFCDKLIPGR
ncbi:hypothetical protein [Chryseolinea lacunae]|uniref:Uncharacterized protein n=1 Tax=Chryseolinea lacunae TaxID=2801331 RepID=A0ABS1KXS8_9BACT|nr:hypothetical protein [Chryseolinea lacunae]MBL0743497.1 hypothetical protein [Chryseolinea lacunae]